MNGNLFAFGDVGFNTPLGYLTVNGVATGINIIAVGDINMGPFNVVTNDSVTSLAGNVNFLSGPVSLISGNLTTSAAEQIFFGFGASGVSGSGFILSASTFNPANGPTGSGISGSVDVAQFFMGGTGGGNISPITQDSFVASQGLQQAWLNTVLLPGNSGFFCVNGFCNLIPVNNPGNIPPTEEFLPPGVSDCGIAGCDNLGIIVVDPLNGIGFPKDIIVYPYTPIESIPERVYSPEESNLLGVVTDIAGDPSQAINPIGVVRDLKIGSPVYKDDQLMISGSGCVCMKTTIGEKKCFSNGRNYDETNHVCKIQSLNQNELPVKKARETKNNNTELPRHSLFDVLGIMKDKAEGLRI